MGAAGWTERSISREVHPQRDWAGGVIAPPAHGWETHPWSSVRGSNSAASLYSPTAASDRLWN